VSGVVEHAASFAMFDDCSSIADTRKADKQRLSAK
jgi:hypothetical protein